MVFSAEILDINAFKDMMRALQVVNKEPTITFAEEGLTSEAMDDSHVQMVNWRLDTKGFLNHYEYGEGDTKITLDLEQFMKFIDGFNKSDTLKLELDEDKNVMLVKGKVNEESGKPKSGRAKSFSIPLLDLELDETPKPKIFFKSQAKLIAKGLTEALKDAMLVGETVTVKLEPEELTISAVGDMGSAYNVWENHSDDLISLKVEESSQSTFILDKVMNLALFGAKCGDVVVIELSSDMPMHLDYESPYGQLEYYVAPVIR